MKKIGIVGGMAPESTVEYYRIITTLARQGGATYRCPVIIIYSVNFEEFISLVQAGNLAAVTELLGDAIDRLSRAGADFALMASNTPHIVFDQVTARSPIPLLSIAAETGKVASELGLKRVGLFGTRFTMQADFYRTILSGKYGISVVTPDQTYQDYIHDKIMNELVNGRIVEETRRELSRIARVMASKQGIEALILGCTELPLILSREVVGMPVLDTTRIHAEDAWRFAQSDKSTVDS